MLAGVRYLTNARTCVLRGDVFWVRLSTNARVGAAAQIHNGKRTGLFIYVARDCGPAALWEQKPLTGRGL